MSIDSQVEQTNAAMRREMRRRKIMMSSEERMKKIMGQVDDDTRCDANIQKSPSISDAMPVTERSHDATELSQTTARTTPPVHTEQTGNSDFRQEIATEQQTETTKDKVQDLSFYRFRNALCFVVGILVRISFLYSFGELYVQTILNPFVALQIALLGYQKSSGMDLGANVKGGLWLSALILSGVNPNLIQSYKSAMGVISAIVDDFTVFFFAFIATHLLI